MFKVRLCREQLFVPHPIPLTHVPQLLGVLTDAGSEGRCWLFPTALLQSNRSHLCLKDSMPLLRKQPTAHN